MTGLRRYFQTSFVLLTILPLLLLGIVLCWFVFYTQLSSDNRFIEQRAQHLAHEIETFFEFQQDEILEITRFRDFLSLDKKVQRDMLLENLTHQPLVRDIALLDDLGNVMQHVSTVDVIVVEAAENRFQQPGVQQAIRSGKSSFGGVTIDPVSQQPIIRTLIPYRAPGAARTSVIFEVTLCLKFLRSLLHDFSSSPGEQIYISDNEHRIISHLNPSYVLAEHHFRPDPTVGLQKNIDGRRAIIKSAAVTLGEQSFHVIVERDAVTALAPAWRATALAAVMLLVSLASASYFNRKARTLIVEPIESLTRTAEAISQGELIRQAKVVGHAEIQQLTTTFNRMTSQLFSSLNSLEEEVAERKKVEQQLRRTQESLSFHLSNTPVGAVVWALDKRVLEWNPAAEKIFGYRQAEVLGKSIFELIILPADELRLKEVFHSLVERRGGFVQTNENLSKDGRTLVCEWHNTPLVDEQGNVYAIASLVTDISERVRLKEMMIQSEKMLSLGTMVAGIAHELNNPLAAILQNTQLLEMRLLQDSPPNRAAAEQQGLSLEQLDRYAQHRKLPDFIQAINESGRRAARIITSMLSFSRKEQGQRQLYAMPLLIDQVVELLNSDYSFEKKFDFRQIRIVRDFSSTLPMVACESSQLQQVLVNILNNAAQAMTDAETVAPQIDIRLRADETTLQLQISDNGPGIDAATRVHIFEPFFTTKQVGKGTGLGLSISYHIITENHQGQMQVDSTPGSGTRFSIRLPLDIEP